MEQVKFFRDHCAMVEKSDIHLNPVKLLVCGTAAANRSMICNAIVGEPLLKEGTATNSREIFEDELNGFHIEVVSIALYDNFRHDLAKYKEELRDIKQEKFDLFLYCLPMKGSRFSLEDKRAYHELQILLNAEIWEHCFIVFTYADSIVKAAQTKYKTDQVNWRVRRDYGEVFAESTASIERLFERKLSFFPAGSPGCYSILRNEDSWLSNLFGAVINVVDTNTGIVLFKKNTNRLRPKHVHGEVTEVHEDPIILSESFIPRLREIIARVEEKGLM